MNCFYDQGNRFTRGRVLPDTVDLCVKAPLSWPFRLLKSEGFLTRGKNNTNGENGKIFIAGVWGL